MINKEEARKIAVVTLNVIAEMEGNDKLDLVLFDDKVSEMGDVWIFPFNTKEFFETNDIRSMVVGVGPIVVNKITGKVFVSPPMPIDNLVKQYNDNNGEIFNWF